MPRITNGEPERVRKQSLGGREGRSCKTENILSLLSQILKNNKKSYSVFFSSFLYNLGLLWPTLRQTVFTAATNYCCIQEDLEQ